MNFIHLFSFKLFELQDRNKKSKIENAGML